jgi:hypothetical protein
MSDEEIENLPTVITSDVETVPLHIVIKKEAGIHEHLDIEFPVDKKACKFEYSGKTYIIKRENIFLKRKGFFKKKSVFYTFFKEDGSPIAPEPFEISSRVLMSAAESQLLKKAMSEFWKKPFNYKMLIYVAVILGVIGIVGYLVSSGMVKFF